MRRRTLSLALVVGLLTALGAIPATAASPWDSLQINHVGVEVDGSCNITARVFWSEINPGRPLDLEFLLYDENGDPAGVGASLTVRANQGSVIGVPVSNPDDLTSFNVKAVISSNSFVVESAMPPDPIECSL